VAPFRDPDDPVRRGRCGADRADRHGTGFEQFGGIASQAGGPQHPVAVSVIRNATLRSLCQSVAVGPFTLVLPAGTGTTPVSADNLMVDADQLSGNATFTNIAIGQDAGALTEVPAPAAPRLLKLLNSLTPLVPVTMTNVTTDDFLVASDSFQANDLNITSG
jgi:hypothetical protein